MYEWMTVAVLHWDFSYKTSSQTVSNLSLPTWFFFFLIALIILVLCRLYIYYGIILSLSEKKKNLLEDLLDCIEFIDQFRKYWHLNNIMSSNPCTWYVFSFIYVFSTLCRVIAYGFLNYFQVFCVFTVFINDIT